MNPIRFTRKRKLRRAVMTTLATVLLGTPLISHADDCQPRYTLGEATLHLPCVDWLADEAQRQVYQADLKLINAEELLFQWGDKSLLTDADTKTAGMFDSTSATLYLPAIEVQTAPGISQTYEVIMREVSNIFSVIAVKPTIVSTNTRPQATSLSRQANLSNPYQIIQLSGSDVDGDVLSYELLSPASGEGYTLAYLNPSSQKLYLVVEPTFNGKISLSYRVTDGKMFSDPATVTINVGSNTEAEEFFFGSKKITAREFAGFNTREGRRSKTGSSSDTTSTQLPTQVDLSSQFPIPRDQGRQNSCIGWAIAYAVKTYQEASENKLTLAIDTTDDHLFSPAFIYNQLNEGMDDGLRINDALNLVVEKGVATLATMPYNELNFKSIPNNEAFLEAQKYKAQEWATVKSSDDMKDALTKGLPIIITMAVYNSFKSIKGSDAVYNTADGEYLGEHAVVIVGYDDNFTGGGAFKVMNSFGQEWGNNGFFWLPYTFLSTLVTINGESSGTLLSGAYVLLDEKKSTSATANEIGIASDGRLPEPEVDESTNSYDLPNLKIADWQVYYDPKIDGKGVLEYKVINEGTSEVSENSLEVSLVLSSSATCDLLYDNYHQVAMEFIPFELEAGQAVSRDETNRLAFEIPPVPSGDYYLHLIVDQYNHVQESNEDDNISHSDKVIPLHSDLPDLTVNSWFAELDYSKKQGKLDYIIINQGKTTAEVPTGAEWKISLQLRRIEPRRHFDQIKPEMTPEEIDNLLGHVTIWERKVQEPLPPLRADQSPSQQPVPFAIPSDQPITFAFDKDKAGKPISPGLYELILMVDSGNTIKQSFYGNDISFAGDFIDIEEQELPSGSSEGTDTIALPQDANANAMTNLPLESTGTRTTQEPPPKTEGTATTYPAATDSTTNPPPQGTGTGGQGTPPSEGTMTTNPPPNAGSTTNPPSETGTRSAKRSDTSEITDTVKYFYNGSGLWISGDKTRRGDRSSQTTFSKTTGARNKSIFPIEKTFSMPKLND